jgi:hypothetical protein
MTQPDRGRGAPAEGARQTGQRAERTDGGRPVPDMDGRQCGRAHREYDVPAENDADDDARLSRDTRTCRGDIPGRRDKRHPGTIPPEGR